MNKPVPNICTRYWIEDNWIYHPETAKSGKYWITDNWIYGPLGPRTRLRVYTGYWISDDWIYGPANQQGIDVYTGFWIADGYIYGPSTELPFVENAG